MKWDSKQEYNIYVPNFTDRIKRTFKWTKHVYIQFQFNNELTISWKLRIQEKNDMVKLRIGGWIKN